MRVGRPPRTNPFSTRFVRPGAIPFQFSDGGDVARLADQLERQAWRGQIIGPHGSGKSTLLAALLPELHRRRTVVTVALHTDRRRFPKVDLSAENSLLVIDGYEQLSWWRRRQVEYNCRLQRCGLLITAHQNLGLPELFRTHVTSATARGVIDDLLSEPQREQFADVDLERGLARHRGSLRDLLFELYDRFENLG